MAAATEESIKVFVRVRPAPTAEDGGSANHCLSVSSPTSLTIDAKPDSRLFTFDHVASATTTQEEVFSTVGRVVIENCLQGYNGTIFAYGQTGSGKTFTMMGPTDEEDNVVEHLRGIIPRSFEHLFGLIDRERQKRGEGLNFLCNCSFLEIYNERVFDLLDASSSGLQLREDVKQGVIVQDITEVPVESPQEAMQVLKAGGRNRRVAETSMNRESSRSHAVFTMTITSKEVGAGNITNIRTSRLNLIDLAGSERQKDTKTAGQRLKEAGSINKSLSALGNVIHALVDIAHGRSRHVAYRDSKLTFLLRDSLGGNTKTYLIANVSPVSKSFGETLSTLNFARRAKMIKNKASINEDMHGNVQALQHEIRLLKEQLSSGAINPAAAQLVSASLGSEGEGASRDLLISAIESREAAEQEKTALLEKIKKLEELCDKKEKCLQSAKMILKFRDNTIKRLESRAKKGKADGTDTDADPEEIEALREEIRQLKGQVEHHPDVTRFAMENLELRRELKSLKSAYPLNVKEHQELVKARRYTLQLEGEVKSLLASTPASPTSATTASSTPADEPSTPVAQRTRGRSETPVAVDSPRQRKAEALQLTNFKQQQEFEARIASLTEDLASFKDEAETATKKLKTHELESQAEIAAAKKAVAEAESALAAHRMKVGLQMKQLEESHSEQLFQLSSPRKQTRRDSVHTDAAAAGGDMWQPIAQVTRDVKALRAKNEALAQETSEAEAATRAVKQELSKAQLQLAAIKDHAASVEQDLKAQAADSQTQITSLTAVVEMIKGDKEALSGRNAELEARIEASESSVGTLQGELAAKELELGAKVQPLEEETIRLRSAIVGLEQQLEQARADLESLRDQHEILLSEDAFKDSVVEDTSAQLRQAQASLQAAQEQQAALEERLEGEKETNSQLISQLEGSVESTAFVEAISSQNALQEQLRGLTARCEAATADNAALEQQIAKLHTAAEDQARSEARQQTALTEMRESVQTVRSQLEDRTAEVESAKNAYTECQRDYMASLEDVDRLTAELKTARAEVVAGKALLTDESALHTKDMENVMQELQRKQEALKLKEVDLKRATVTAAGLQADKEALSKEAGEMHARAEALEAEAVALRKQASEAAATAGGSQDADVAALELEVATYKKKQAQLLAMVEEAEQHRQGRVEEIAALQAQVKLQPQLEERLSSVSDELEQTTGELEKERRARAKAAANFKVQEKDKVARIREQQIQLSDIRKQKRLIESKLSKEQVTLESALEDAEVLVLQLEKSQSLETQMFAEKERYKSKLETLNEELMRHQAELEAVTKDRDQLVGHQNKQQKIQHFMQIKHENSQLKQDLVKAKSEIGRLLQKVEHAKASRSKRSSLTNKENAAKTPGLADVTNA